MGYEPSYFSARISNFLYSQNISLVKPVKFMNAFCFSLFQPSIQNKTAFHPKLGISLKPLPECIDLKMLPCRLSVCLG